MDKYETHPSFMEGEWVGRGMARKIEQTSYRNLETAINAKKSYLNDLENQLGLTEQDKDHLYVQGMIAGLEEALSKQEEE